MANEWYKTSYLYHVYSWFTGSLVWCDMIVRSVHLKNWQIASLVYCMYSRQKVNEKRENNYIKNQSVHGPVDNMVDELLLVVHHMIWDMKRLGIEAQSWRISVVGQECQS